MVPPCKWKGNCCFSVCHFLAEILPHLNIKAVHNLKTKSLGIILTPWAMFVPIFAFLLFLVSKVVYREECALFCHFWAYLFFLLILPQ